MKKIFYSIFFIFVLFLIFSFKAQATEDPNRYYFINLDKKTIAKGYTVTAFDNSLKLSLVPGILSEETGVSIVELNEPMEMPWQLNRISKIYQFDFRNKAAYDNHKPFYIQFSYNKDSNNQKTVYFFDKNFNAWRPLPTRDYPNENFVRSLIHLPYARIAVFEDPDFLTVGKASWYAYKGGNYAASPDYAKGSIIRVHNLDWEEGSKYAPYVDVEINDYGPDRSIHPDRPVDLDKVAFSRIAPLGAGVINVNLEPIKVVLNENDESADNKGRIDPPEILSKSVSVLDEETGELVFSKNEDEKLPIASLTKIVGIKTFLDLNPGLDLNKIVAYSKNDEEINYIYCNQWESARIRLADGDTLTIKDLIYATLVGSANNSMETLVRVSGISRDDFIRKMNENISSWGATSTYFVEPTGLSPLNVSSAKDYAIIMKEVLKNNLIADISTSNSYRFTTLRDKKTFNLYNTNHFLNLGGELQITGSKTGYLNEAGHCLAVRISNGEKNMIIVILGAESKEQAAKEAKNLFKYSLSLLQ